MGQEQSVSEARKLIAEALELAESRFGVRIIRGNAKRHEETGDLEVVRLTYETKDDAV